MSRQTHGMVAYRQGIIVLKAKLEPRERHGERETIFEK
jgi:hypothetical protein